MPRLTFRQIAEFTGGTIVQGADLVADSYVIDSREAKPGSLFFALIGDRLDGHAFLDQALEKSIGAVVSSAPENVPADRGVIRVEDTLLALQNLARAIRRSMRFMVIGITGSAGKTTTKEMIATLVDTERRTWRSMGNFNNHIGLPLSLANTPDGTEVVVSEMGMSAKGEIEFLARLAQPDLGVYTNIKPVHLEFFGSIDGIAAAKRELLENVKPGGYIVINADEPKVMKISEGFTGGKILYGRSEKADYRGVDIVDRGLFGSRFTVVAEGERRTFDVPLPGVHNLENLLAAIATARSIGISWNGIESGVAALKPAYHRGVAVKWRGATLYDDTYNSNPYALGRALELMSNAECEGKRIAVIGDMLELGPQELDFHREAGRSIPKSVDRVIAVGPRSRAILEGAASAGFAADRLNHFDTAADVAPFLREIVGAGDLVLLKGSRGIGLDRVITALESEG